MSSNTKATSTKSLIKTSSRKSSIMKSTLLPIVEKIPIPQYEEDEDNLVTINAIYGSKEELVEISVVNVRHLTVKPLQVTLLLAANYQQLTKFSIIRTGIDEYVINELSKTLPQTTITEVYLKELKHLEGNYATLLGPMTCLQSLTINSCEVNDKVCEQIAYRLHHTSTAGKTLVTLDLSFNHISDEGAKYLAEALRTNRCLRSLNLANNRITDRGASFIFNILVEFPLTAEEVIAIRREKFRLEFARPVEVEALNIRDSPKSKSVKGKSPVAKKSPRVILTNDIKDAPFANANLYIGDRTYMYCTGNHVLCHLNLAYNDLTHSSIIKLSKVLNSQCKVMRKTEIGLVRVVIEGNNISAVSPEMKTIHYFLSNNISRLTTKKSKLSAQRSNTSKPKALST